MKNRNLWFMSFYLILSTFLFYQIVFVFLLWQNNDLYQLYQNGFQEVPEYSLGFNHSSLFSVFYLPLIGLIISGVSLACLITLSRIFLLKKPNMMFPYYVFVFITFIGGFFLSFVGQLFYNQWSNPTIMIKPNNGEQIVSASDYYQKWFPSTIIWSIFGIYFAFIVACVILMIKLHFINVQTYNFYRQRQTIEELEPELKEPLPSSSEFDPNETQTITIFLDDTRNFKQRVVKRLKKKQKKAKT